MQFISCGFLFLSTCVIISCQEEAMSSRKELLRRGREVVNEFYQRYSTKEVDLVFVIDRSASVRQSGWTSMLNFVRSLLEHFTVDGENTRVAIVTYSSIASVDINDLAETNKNKCSLMQRIQQKLRNKPLSGYTATHDALVATKNLLYNSRRSAKKAVFVLTDGRSNIGPPPVRASVEMRSLRWNATWNYTFFGPQLEIYAFGIQNADISELISIASPLPNHTYHIPDFVMFEDLARSLHKDKQDEKWDILSDISRCPSTCSVHAYCTCATKRGDYQCICKEGYEGNGHQCTECSLGYYKDTITPQRCKKCSGNTTTSMAGAKHAGSCRCVPPYHQEQGGHSCELKHCPELPDIPHGHKFHIAGRVTDEHPGVNVPCDNTPGNSCHYTCDDGYRLTGHPGLVCEVNGTWIGNVPVCQVIDCKALEYHGQLDPHGSTNYINDSTTFGSVVEVSCDSGWRPFGDTIRTCTKHGMWSGTRTWCVESRCSKLPSVVGGEILPASCSVTHQIPGQICEYHCYPGYQIHGQSRKTCQNNGLWDYDNDVICTDIQPPEIECPNDIRAPVTEGNYSVIHWDAEKPKVRDNSGAVRVQVIGFRESPVRLAKGYHQITYLAEDKAENQASCIRGILIVDRTIRVTYCPSDILIIEVYGYEQEVTWSDPEFLDNHNQSMAYQCTRQSGSVFTIGTFTVHCSPVVQSEVFCQFTVELQRKRCQKPAPPIHGSLTCIPSPPSSLEVCSVQCNSNYDFFDFPQKHYICGLDGQWNLQFTNQFWPDCSLIHYPGMAMMNGEYEYFYYSGECQNIKQQITDIFRRKIQLHAWQLCGAATCSVNNVEVICGLQSRKRRSIDRNENGTNYNISSLNESDDNLTSYEANHLSNLSDVDLVNLSNATQDSTELQERPHKKYLKIKFKVNISANGNTGQSQRIIWRGHRMMSIRLQRYLQRENISISYYNNGILMPVEVVLDTSRHKILDLTFENCPQGFVLKLDTVLNLCVACPIGTYYYSENDTETCNKCPVGSYQDTEGSSECIKCPLGYTTVDTGAVNVTECLAPCPVGHFSSSGLQPCIPCPGGYYENRTGSTSCLPCPANTHSIPGHTSSLNDCKVPCSPGAYNEHTGLEPCIACPLSTFQSEDGATDCLLCPDNLSTLHNGSSSVSDCREIDICQNVTNNVCENNGNCVTGRLGYTCDCLPGFHGDRCEFNINECNSSPCNNNGTCVDEQADFTCICTSGYTGKTCTVEVNECDLEPCENGGSCEDLRSGYRCYCPYTHTGVNCEQPLYCSQHPCYHGDCQELQTGYKCLCEPGYRGENCDKIDFCRNISCRNSAECRNIDDDFMCICPTGYKGTLCEIRESVLSPCSSNPCKNNGQCLVLADHFYCKCQPGYGGHTCEEEVSANFDLVFGDPGITDYVMLRLDSVDITAISACMWLRTSDSRNYGTPFSYAAETNYITAEESDMFTLTDYGRLKIYISGEVAMTTVSVNNGMWHHVCVSWDSHGGKWWLYVNGTVVDRGDNLANGAIIPGHGYFIIGQKQHIIGDGFSSWESYIGEISQLNVYDHVLSLDNISGLSNQTFCNMSYFGNVVAWTDVIGRLDGKVEMQKDSFCLDKNECKQYVTSACPENKKCEDLIGGYNCSGCVYGYQGDSCNEPINECGLDVCDNGGSCVDGPLPHDYSCYCISGYTGVHCETSIDSCEQRPCVNNGTCVPHRNGYVCMCTDTLNMDMNCQYLTSPCRSNPCQNLGVCNIKNNTFSCSCLPGFKGRYCEVRVSSCYDNLCKNGGTCVSTSLGTYMCECPSLWKGAHCEVEYTPSCEQSPCLNNGICVNITQGYECECPDIPDVNWGPNCEQNACEANPCQNNGMCLYSYDNTYTCVCDSAFTGDNCEVNITQLHSQKAMTTHSYSSDNAMTTNGYSSSNNVTAQNILDDVTTTGVDLCDTVICANGGTCYRKAGQVLCHCLRRYTGMFCTQLRERVTQQYQATILLNLPFHDSYKKGRLFKPEFRRQVRGVYNSTIRDGGRLQVTDISVRRGTDAGTLVSYKLTYTDFEDSEEPSVSMDDLENVMEECLDRGYLGHFTVSRRNFEFREIYSDSLKDDKPDKQNDIADSNVTVYLIVTIILLLAILLVIAIFITIRLRKTRYRKTTKLLQGLNNTSNNALNLIANPVFEDTRERTPSGEYNMYAELADMLDPYCVTAKSDISDEEFQRRSLSRYSSTRSVRSNKDSNLQRAAARKCSELSDMSFNSPKKLNSPSESISAETVHYLSPFSNKNEFDFSNSSKKDTKELLPAFCKVVKNSQPVDLNSYLIPKEQKENISKNEPYSDKNIQEDAGTKDDLGIRRSLAGSYGNLLQSSNKEETEMVEFCKPEIQITQGEINQTDSELYIHPESPNSCKDGKFTDITNHIIYDPVYPLVGQSSTHSLPEYGDLYLPSLYVNYDNTLDGAEENDELEPESVYKENELDPTDSKKKQGLIYYHDKDKSDFETEQNCISCNSYYNSEDALKHQTVTPLSMVESNIKLPHKTDSRIPYVNETSTRQPLDTQPDLCHLPCKTKSYVINTENGQPLDITEYGSSNTTNKTVPEIQHSACEPANQALPYIKHPGKASQANEPYYNNDSRTIQNENGDLCNCINKSDQTNQGEHEIKLKLTSVPYTYDYADAMDIVKRQSNKNRKGTLGNVRRDDMLKVSGGHCTYINEECNSKANMKHTAPSQSSEDKMSNTEVQTGDEENYVLPNSSDDQNMKKKNPLNLESHSDYMDMSGGKALLRENSFCFDKSKRSRHRSADDYLEVLPPKPEDLPSTLPRTAKHKDMSKRKLPPLPKFL